MDRPTFFHHLRRSNLLPFEQVDQCVARFADEADTDAIARTLVTEGVLTRYQAEQLLAGRSKGFLLGQYRIVDQLGQGGMGFVLKAVHTPMNRVVAIKVINPKQLKDAQDVKLFQREMCAAAQLHHPNIVAAYDASRARGVYYLVMEYVDGPNLEKFVRRRGPLPVWLACDLMRQAADALQHAHEKGIVHRDVKPANLLIDGVPNWRERDYWGSGLSPAMVPEWRPALKILDFGLARLHVTPMGKAKQVGTILVQAGDVYGTPDYVSPEQAHNLHAADIRSDLYSLGCTFYVALTGKVPFPGATSLEKLIQHAIEEPAPLAQYRPDVPQGVVAIIRRLMAKDPAHRYQTPAELADALAPWCLPNSRAGSVETKVGSTLNTPAGTDPDIGTGWVFDAGPYPAGTAATLDEPAGTLSVQEFILRHTSRRRRWKLWLNLGLTLGAALLVSAFVLYFRR